MMVTIGIVVVAALKSRVMWSESPPEEARRQLSKAPP
jgi:hypothetical protein